MAIDNDNNGKEWTPEKVHNCCEQMQLVERVRANDRALINAQFNGSRPYTPDEETKYQIHTNVNWGEGRQLLIPAINQLNNALIFKDVFFTAHSKGGKIEKRQEYGDIFTRNIHVPLKEGATGLRQMFLLKSRNASVALHGIGPIMWRNKFRWRAHYVPLEDLLIPTDTFCDFSNLMFFGVNLYLTLGEFFDMVFGETNADKGWNKKAVGKIIDDMMKPNNQYGPQQFQFEDQPEKRVEWLKQNRYMLDWDATATVKLRMFYYKDYKTKKWHRCAVLREGTPHYPVDAQKVFLYDGRDAVYASGIGEILHVQYGDSSLVAPLKYHSVRGLGVSLYSPVECNNRLRCEMVQHVFLNLKTILRVTNPIDRDRPHMLNISQYSVLEDGVGIVPNTERHQIDPRLVEYAQSQMRQIMAENSASYVQDINDGTSKEMTATETNARVQSVNVQVSAMLQSCYTQEDFYWHEEVRRFLDKTSEDDEVKEFQEACKRDGIPDELMVPKNWRVKTERVLGAGDQFLAVQEANMLLQQKDWMDPTSQRMVQRKWVSTVTRDHQLGRLLVPERPTEATPGVIAAEDVFGTLMQGMPCAIREGIDRAPYIESLLGMMGNKIQQIQQISGMGTPEDLMGLNAVGQHIQQNIQILAQDQSQKSAVKLYGDELGKLMNEVKAFTERQQEAMQAAQQQQDQAAQMEAKAKADSTIMLAQAKAQVTVEAHQQKMAIMQAEFQQKMGQMLAEHQQKMAITMQNAQVQVAAQGVTTGSQIVQSEKKTEAEIAQGEQKTEAEITAMKKKAAATPEPAQRSE